MNRGLQAAAAAACLILTASAPAPAAKSDRRLTDPVAPVRQSIHLRLDPDVDEFRGTVVIHLEVRDTCASLGLHAEDLTVETAAVRDHDIAVTVEREADDVIRLICDPPLPPGAAELEIGFRGVSGDKSVGLYRVEYEGRRYLFTQFEADDARQAFPCFDEPAFKIPFEMTLTVPEAQFAVSNTPVESESVTDGWRTIVYRRTEPLPTYLLAIAVGPLEAQDIPGLSVPGRIVYPVGKGALTGVAREMTPPLLVALERWFDSRHPFAKVDLIAVPEFWPGAMENAGAITYKDRILLLDPATATPAERRNHARVTAHELAHQWFGNLVTMEWWDDLWLNEAFADWMGGKIVEEVYPELQLALAELAATQRNLAADARPSTKPVRRPIRSTERLLEGVGLTYAKGRTVLGMFERWMGPEPFRRGVLDYLRANRRGNARAHDLWRALDAASGTDVSGAMSGFLDQPGFPLVRAERVGGNRVRLSQRRFRNLGVEMPELTWRVPVVLRWSSGGVVRERSLLLDGDATEIDLEGAPADWIHPNGGASGYYRWALPERDLLRLAAGAGRELTERERVEFLGNLGALLGAGEVGGRAYLEILTRFADDPSPAVVSSLVEAVAGVHGPFVGPELENAYAAWVRRVLQPALDRIGRDPRGDDPESVTLLRPGLIGVLADEGADHGLARWCRDRAEDYLADPASVDPSLASIVLRVAAIDGDEDLYRRYVAALERTSTPVEHRRMLGALESFRRPEIRERHFAWALETLRPDEFLSALRSATGTEAGRDAALAFLEDQYDRIAPRLPTFRIAWLPFLAGGCSPERLERAADFFGDPERAVAGTGDSILRMTDQVRDCTALREREGSAVAAFLRSVPGGDGDG